LPSIAAREDVLHPREVRHDLRALKHHKTSNVTAGRGPLRGAKAKLFKVTNHWLTLSEELVVNVFGFLEQADLGRTCLVCKSWNRLALDEALWRTMVMTAQKMSPELLFRSVARNPRNMEVVNCDFSDFEPLGPIFFTSPTPPRKPISARSLNLNATRIKDRDVAELLRMMPELRVLEFGGNTDPLGEHMSRALAESCKKLVYIGFRSVKGLTAAGFEQITASCGMLRALSLGWSSGGGGGEGDAMAVVGDDPQTLPFELGAIQSLAKNCPNLEHLDLSGFGRWFESCHPDRDYDIVSDESVEFLCSSCTKLKTLDLSDAYKLTDSAVFSIMQHLDQIEHISLSRCTRISAKAVERLAKKSGVKEINIFGLNMAVDELEEAVKTVAFNVRFMSKLDCNDYID
jgi:hypothetical protein